MSANARPHTLRAGMVGMGMIFDETYRPMFEALHADGLYRRDFGYVDVALAAVATRTGARARAYKKRAGSRIADFTSFEGAGQRRAVRSRRASTSSASPRRTTGTSTPRSRPSRRARHVLIEKPSVLDAPAARRARGAGAARSSVLAKVVYHKLCDPDHKKLRTLVDDGELRHVNNGYCSLLEPKSHRDGAVRRVDRGTQSRHLRRRPLHQADRLHVRRAAARPSPAPASAASSGRPTATPGTRPSCG